MIELKAPFTLIRVTLSVYPPGAWLKATTDSDTLSDTEEEEWTLQSTISEWSWRALSALKDNGEHSFGTCPTFNAHIASLSQPHPNSRCKSITLPLISLESVYSSALGYLQFSPKRRRARKCSHGCRHGSSLRGV